MAASELTEQTDVLVIGGGPGGYVAAFRAADLGLRTTIVEKSPLLGGICLRAGCIPSKTLLHVAHLIESAALAKDFGVTFAEPKIDIDRLRGWKQAVVDKLCGGIKTLAKKRGVRVIQDTARFEDSGTVRIEGGDVTRLKFKNAIIATGSRLKTLPEKIMPADCCLDSSGALDLEVIPQALCIVGGGYIGLELGQVYAALGSRVTVIEVLDRILTGPDDDLARPLVARLKKQFDAIHTGAALVSARKTGRQIEITFTKGGRRETLICDRVLVSVGREPNAGDLGLENTKVVVNARGFIAVDEARRTADQCIYAIGDVAGNPMLAHKASREGIVAAEAIAGQPSVFDPRAIPAVVYTSPELAWCGLTENEAKEKGVEVKVGKFLWGASGRALAMGRPAGMTKVIADTGTHRVLGVGIVGEHAGDLIAEAVLAIEMGARAEDLAHTIHPHPSTSETLMEAAENVLGTAIHALRKV
ncbi:MAG: dihydrolipoyl dehydrogenase [Phycisphaerae bacterium]|nr:dihydrolipoyl dehydrogenase [Phycisphaerae bacterium]